MGVELLPAGFDSLVSNAIKIFWATRSKGAETQEGSRGNVIGGKNLDGFIEVVERIAIHCGLPSNSVLTRGRTNLTIPGYFRPTKNWDALVIHHNRLVAAFEFKSQVGSFGNNFNNRTEEVLGNATDLWAAHSNGAYTAIEESGILVAEGHDPRPPFVGYLMLLQEDDGSTRNVAIRSPNFDVLPEFMDSSYADRYRILCEKLMEENLYSAAALALSDCETGLAQGNYRSLSPATSIENLFREFAGRAAAAATESTEGK